MNSQVDNVLCVYSASGATVHSIVLLLRCSVVGGVNSLLNMLHCSLVPGNQVDRYWLELVRERQRMNPCRFGNSTQHFENCIVLQRLATGLIIIG